MKKLIVLTTLLLSTTVLLGQPAPNAPQPNAGPAPINTPDTQAMWGGQLTMMVNHQQEALVRTTPQGIFVLRNGVLAKFNGHAIQPTGVLELDGPLQAAPAENASVEVWHQYAFEAAKRALPIRMVAKGNDLYIADILQLWHVDGVTMKLKATIPLIDAKAYPQELFMLTASSQPPPQLEIGEKIVVVLLGPLIVGFDPTIDKKLFEGKLPSNMQQNPAAEPLMNHFRYTGPSPYGLPDVKK